MTRRRAILAIGVAAVLVLLIGWPGGGRPARTVRPAPDVAVPEQAPERQVEARAVARVTEFPRGAPVPREELLDDPNRVPGPELRISGFVVRSDRPVEGAVVRLCRAFPSGRSPEPPPHPFAETRSLDNGSFVAHGARRSSLVVEVRHEGSATRRLFLVMPLVGDPEPVRIELAAGHELAVKVIEPAGAPVADATVRVRCAGGAAQPAPLRSAPEFCGTTRTAPRAEVVAKTDALGRAVFRDIEAGSAEIDVDGVLENVVVPTGGDVVFEHEPRGTIEGVLRREDGQPVADATFSVETIGFRDRLGTAETRTNAEGRFRVEGVPPGWVTGGRADRSPIDAAPVLLRPGAVVEWNPVIRPSIGIRGRTIGADGSPLADVRVLLLERTGWPDLRRDALDVAWSDDAGQFELRAPEPGGYDLRAEAFALVGSADATAPCAPLDVRLVPCSRVVGRIRGLAEGNDLATVRLELLPVPLDAAGRFAFEHVMPVRKTWIVPGRGHFEVPAGAVVELDESYSSRQGVEAESWGRIVGEVRDHEGRPVAGAVVSYPEYGFIDMKFIQPACGNTTATDDDGRFALRVAPGWLERGYCVAVARPGFAPQRSRLFHRKPQPGEIERLDFTLEPAPRLHGRVLGARGEPVRYVYVEANVRAPKDFFFEESTYTAHDGTFRFTRLPHGSCKITAWVEGTKVEVEAELGEREVVLSLAEPEGETIAGIVVPTGGRSTVVVATSAGGTYDAVSRESGRFRLTGLPPGRYDVRVEGGSPVRNVPTGTDDLVLSDPP